MKTKKILSIILSAVMIITIIPVMSVAKISEDWKYFTNSDGTAGITGYTGSETELTIPEEIDGYTVTSIGNRAFQGCTSLKSITVPDSITSIGDYAFYNCELLTSVTIGNSVTSIGNRAFQGCTSLQSITVDENNQNYSSDEYGVLFNKDKTEIIQYPVGNERTSYDIPNSVISIGERDFYGCTSLQSITIPESITSIGNRAFQGCTSLQSITVDENNQYYSSDEYGVLFNKDKTKIIQYPVGNERTSYDIPDGVTSIGYGAFERCTSLISVTIPDSVTSIRYGAFERCTLLTSVTIGNSVTSIGDYAFYNCESLTSVTIGDSVTSIGDCPFLNCTSLQSITVDENNQNYSSDEYGVLFNKDKTKLIQYPIGNERISYDIPDSVTSIESCAFYDCTLLTSITIPDSVTSIESCAFYDCTSLTSITIPDSVTSIEDFAFHDCISLTSITIPDSVTSIGDYAFEECTSLTSITIPNSVTSIGWSAFYDCTSLTSITIPDSVTSIGDCAIGYCYNSDTHGNEIINGFIIYGVPGSAAEFYASKNGITFIDVANKPAEEPTTEEPTTQEPAAKEPTSDEPISEEITSQEPISEEPISDEPISNEPISDEASSGEPSTAEPATSIIINDGGRVSADDENKYLTITVADKKSLTAAELTAKLGNENVKIVDKDGNELGADALVGTGAKVRLLDESENVASEYEVIVPSDVNGDGKTTAADARIALRASARLDDISGVYSIAADMSGDGKITAADARKILRMSAGLE